MRKATRPSPSPTRRSQARRATRCQSSPAGWFTRWRASSSCSREISIKRIENSIGETTEVDLTTTHLPPARVELVEDVGQLHDQPRDEIPQARRRRAPTDAHETGPHELGGAERGGCDRVIRGSRTPSVTRPHDAPPRTSACCSSARASTWGRCDRRRARASTSRGSTTVTLRCRAATAESPFRVRDTLCQAWHMTLAL